MKNRSAKNLAASKTPEADLARMELVHQLLLALGTLTALAAVGGSHGLF